MSRFRVWLFRSLVAIAAGLMVTSWFLPWWTCTVVAMGAPVARIYPYGLWLNMEKIGGYTFYIKGAEMPVWFAPLMWTYLGICVAALLYSLLTKEKVVNLGRFKLSLPQALIGGVGLSYIVVAVLAVIVATIRTGNYFDTPLQGSFVITLEGELSSNAFSNLNFGYWLACGVGPLLTILALLRNKIIGKLKLDV